MEDKKKIKKVFTAWNMNELEKAFDLTELNTNKHLQNLLNTEVELTDFENQNLKYYLKMSANKMKQWNEQELITKFIGPMISLVNFDTPDFNYFAERYISAIVGDYEMLGRADGMIATGKWEPEIPFFFISEYKREVEPRRNPMAQNLAEMIVAQKLNNNKCPVYGAYIVGKQWHFMILEGKTYTVSNAYVATRDDIFDIFKILKNLKTTITEILKKMKAQKEEKIKS